MTNPTDLRGHDAVLLDLDGTIFHEEVALPGAAELIAALRRRGQPFAFVSNSGLSPSQLIGRFGRMGIAGVEPSRIFTAASACCEYVRAYFDADARVFNVGGEAYEELLAGRVRFVGAGEPCDVVMSASMAGANAAPARLAVALRRLAGGGVPLVALCADRSYPSAGGLEIGAGGVAAMLAYAANVVPVYCGKPNRVFFETLCRALGVRPSRCVLVGDNLDADVAGAKPFGMRTVLPLTGVTTRAHLDALDPALAPDVVIDDLRALL